MCLENRVANEEKHLKRVERTKTAYKVFRKDGKRLLSLFYDKPFMRENLCSDLYSAGRRAGFYCYIYKKDALAVMRRIGEYHGECKYVTKKVTINEVLGIGICNVVSAENEPTAPVITTDSILIPDLE